MRLLLALGLLLVSPAVASSGAFAQPAETAPGAISETQERLAEHLAIPFASGLAGARDAPVFAWVENAAGVRNVWVARAGSPASQLTSYQHDDGIEISGIALDPAGQRLAFVRGGDAEWADGALPNTGQFVEPPEQSLYLADLAGGEPPAIIGRGHDALFSPNGRRIAFVRAGAIMVTDGSQEPQTVARLRGTVGDLSWSPDGNLLLFRELRPGHSVVGVIDIDAGSLDYLGATLGHSADPVFSPDGRSVGFIQFREPPADMEESTASFWSLRVADVTTGAVRTVWSAPPGEGSQYYGTRGRNLFWSATGELLFPWERTGWLQIYAVSQTGGEARNLTPDANEVENFQLTPNGRGLVYSANPGDLDSRSLWRVSLSGGPAERMTEDGTFAFFPMFAGDRLAATVTDARRPAHMVLVDGMEALGRSPSVEEYSPPENVTFEASDGVQIHAQLFRARGARFETELAPALIFAHGGPRRQMLPAFHPLYYYHNSYVRNQEFAAHGYTVLSVNYRSGTNYGRAFREAAETGRDGAAEYRDILAGGRWLAARPDVDPKKIGIWGGSWGGYLTALALARDSDLFAAGVDLHGVHAMVRDVSDTYAPEEARAMQQLQWESSPMGAMDTWRSPVLIVHGDDDRNVDYRQSLLLARELSARDVLFEELAFPNERHDFFRYDHWLETYLAAGDFFDRHLRAAE